MGGLTDRLRREKDKSVYEGVIAPISDSNMEDEEPLTPFGQVFEWIGYNPGQVQVLEEVLGDLKTMGSATRNEVADALKHMHRRLPMQDVLYPDSSRPSECKPLLIGWGALEEPEGR